MHKKILAAIGYFIIWTIGVFCLSSGAFIIIYRALQEVDSNIAYSIGGFSCIPLFLWIFIELSRFTFYSIRNLFDNHAHIVDLSIKISNIKKHHNHVANRIIEYMEYCESNGLYDINYLYNAILVLEVILYKPQVGFLWNSNTGQIVIQYRTLSNNSLVRVILNRDEKSSITVATSINEYTFNNTFKFKKAFDNYLN